MIILQKDVFFTIFIFFNTTLMKKMFLGCYNLPQSLDVAVLFQKTFAKSKL